MACDVFGTDPAQICVSVLPSQQPTGDPLRPCVWLAATRATAFSCCDCLIKQPGEH